MDLVSRAEVGNNLNKGLLWHSGHRVTPTWQHRVDLVPTLAAQAGITAAGATLLPITHFSPNSLLCPLATVQFLRKTLSLSGTSRRLNQGPVCIWWLDDGICDPRLSLHGSKLSLVRLQRWDLWSYLRRSNMGVPPLLKTITTASNHCWQLAKKFFFW